MGIRNFLENSFVILIKTLILMSTNKSSRSNFRNFENDLSICLKIGPDGRSVKTMLSYMYNDRGMLIEITTKTRFTLMEKMKSPAVKERSQIPYFDRSLISKGCETVTIQSSDEILIEKKIKNDGDINTDHFKPTKLGASTNLNHILSRKRLLRTNSRTNIITETIETKQSKENLKTGSFESSNESFHPRETILFENTTPISREEHFCLRIDNISEEATDQDLRELLGKFKHVTKVHIAKRDNGGSRGYGFVNFSAYADAHKAKMMLNGHGYANLILRVEFVRPKHDRTSF